MEYITKVTDYKIEENTAISLGKFDGIHLGHKILINDILKHKNQYKTVIYTFDMNPAAKIKGQNQKLITTNLERKELLSKMGIDYLIECPFNDEIRNMEAKDFIRKIVRELSIKYIAVGEDFAFGHNRQGNSKMLEEMADELGYKIEVFPKAKYNDRDISSTYVREEISKGNVSLANKLLGYNYSIKGIVEHGNKLGRKIGFPTINVCPDNEKLLFPNGVYVSRVIIDGNLYNGITNIGTKPTVNNNNDKNAETYIYNFDKDIYGKNVSIELIEFLREEKKFPSIEALKEQLSKDIETGKNFFEK